MAVIASIETFQQIHINPDERGMSLIAVDEIEGTTDLKEALELAMSRRAKFLRVRRYNVVFYISTDSIDAIIPMEEPSNG